MDVGQPGSVICLSVIIHNTDQEFRRYQKSLVNWGCGVRRGEIDRALTWLTFG